MSLPGTQKSMSSGGQQISNNNAAYPPTLLENIKERLILQKAQQEQQRGATRAGGRYKSPEYSRTQTSMNSLLGSDHKQVERFLAGEQQQQQQLFQPKRKEKFIAISSPKSGSKEKPRGGDRLGRSPEASEEKKKQDQLSSEKFPAKKLVKKALNYNSIQAASLSQLKQTLSKHMPGGSSAMKNKAHNSSSGLRKSRQGNGSGSRDNSNQRDSVNKRCHTSMSLHEAGSGSKKKMLSSSAFVGLLPNITTNNIQRASEHFQTLPTEADSNYLSSLNRVKYNNFFKNISSQHSTSKKKPRPRTSPDQKTEGTGSKIMPSNTKAANKPLMEGSPGGSVSSRTCHDLAEIEKLIDDYILRTEPPAQDKNQNVTDYFQEIFPFLNNLSEKHELIGSIFKKVRLLFERPCRKIMEQYNGLRQFYRLHKDSAKEVETLQHQKANLEQQFTELLQEFQNLQTRVETHCDQREGKSYVAALEENLKAAYEENEKLKLLVKKQRQKLNDSQLKEDKIMRLLYAIRISGVNIESIYDEYVRTPKGDTSKMHAGMMHHIKKKQSSDDRKGSIITDESFQDDIMTPQAWEEMLGASVGQQQQQLELSKPSAEGTDPVLEAARIKQIKSKITLY
jgi:hypothetical protein